MGHQPDRTDQLLTIYTRLFAAYGPQGWWPGGHDPFEVIVGAILTQSAAWTNVEKALTNLRNAGALTPEALLKLSEEELGRLVRPSGYFQMKARKLQAFARMLQEEAGGDLSRLFAQPLPALRTRLLATYGIGPETADDILLYAARKPVFVVDAYTVRIFRRLGIMPGGDLTLPLGPSSPSGPTVTERGFSSPPHVPNPQSASRPRQTYAAWQRLFMAHLPSEVPLYNEYHALLVRHGKVRCRKRIPLCEGCPLLDLCLTGRGESSYPQPLAQIG